MAAATCAHVFLVAQIWQSGSVRPCPLRHARLESAVRLGVQTDAGAKAGPGRPATPTLSRSAFEIQDVGFNLCLQIATACRLHVLPSLRLPTMCACILFLMPMSMSNTLFIYQVGTRRVV